MKKLTILLVLLFCLPCFAQRDTLLGRVMAGGGEAPNVFIINKNTGAEVKTGSKGLFKIPVRNGDRLVVYSNRTEVREFIAGQDWFAAMPYSLEVELKAEQLETVVIDKNITSENLGLVPEGQKRYTVAERRLKTASDARPLWLVGVGMLGGAFPLDPLINAITGRTKMLKKELATERQLMGLETIGSLYTDEEISRKLAIPAEKVQGFLFYAVENAQLMAALKEKNASRAELELSILAEQYLEMQADSVQASVTVPAQRTDGYTPEPQSSSSDTDSNKQQQKP